MKNLFLSLLVFTLGMSVNAQQTVNVKPGDDLQAAVEKAGPGGTVVFAPGMYNVLPADPSEKRAIRINESLEGITLKGAGSGFDPAKATIFNGDAGFLGSAIYLELAKKVTVEGFTFTSFWDSAVMIQDSENCVFKNCWIMGSARAVEVNGTSGYYDSNTPNDFSDMTQFLFCAMAKSQDVIVVNDASAVLLKNCDVRDGASDIIECEDDSTLLIVNSIVNAGFLSDDVQPDGNSWIETRNSVFFEEDKPDSDITEIDFKDLATVDEASIYANPKQVNANFASPMEQFNFHLLADSPALTAGKDEAGNPTFAGSAGPAQ